jgi:hypothetical protein
MSLSLVGCNPDELSKQLKSSDKTLIPSDPVISHFNYLQNGSTVSEVGPFPVARLIYPDLETGICASLPNQAEVSIFGSFDPEKTANLELTGPTKTEVTPSGSSFVIRACLPAGSTLMTLRAKTADNKVNRGNVILSLTLTPSLKTLAFGHPRYPSVGFRQGVGGLKVRSLSSQGLTARQFTLGEPLKNSIPSSGAPGYSLSLGFPEILKLDQP